MGSIRYVMRLIAVLFFPLVIFPISGNSQSLGEHPFITRWKCAAGEVIEVPLIGDYNYTWALASVAELPSVQVASVAEGGMLRLQATVAGEYLLKAGSEGVRYLQFQRQGSQTVKTQGSYRALVRVEKWGAVAWESMRGAFYYCENMELSPDAGAPNLSGVTDMHEMFFACRKLNTSLNDWDVSNVTNMGYMFLGCWNFNQPLDRWNVSKVEVMSYMFANCHTFNQNLNSWDVSSAKHMYYMFSQCFAFNQPLSSWRPGKVTEMKRMFSACHNFNQDLSGWDVSSVKSMHYMFSDCYAFNSDLGDWNVEKVTNMEGMFFNCHSFNQDLSRWKVQRVATMSDMFTNCYQFDRSLSGWTPRDALSIGLRNSGMSQSNYESTLASWASKRAQLKRNVVVDAGWLLYSAGNADREALRVDKAWNFTGDQEAGSPRKKPFITRWKVTTPGKVLVPLAGRYAYVWKRVGDTGSEVVQQADVHDGELLELDAPTAGVYELKAGPEGVRYIRFFSYSTSSQFGSVDALQTVEQWGDVRWESMELAFYNCKNLQLGNSVGIPDLSLVSSLFKTFLNCRSLNQSLNDWDVSGITNLSYTFYGCTSFNQPLNKWKTSNVTNLRATFANCYVFNQDLNDWDVSSVTDLGSTFSKCFVFNSELSNWKVDKVENMRETFLGCHSFNQPLRTWKVSQVNHMGRMFADCRVFNQPLDGWDVRKVEKMSQMFSNCYAFNGDLSGWDVSGVREMALMFFDCAAFNQPVGNWDVRGVVNMDGMFSGCYAFDQDLGAWDPLKIASVGLDCSGLGVDTYSNTLAAWAAKKGTLPRDVVVYAEALRYNAMGESARAELENDRGWRFIGDLEEGLPVGRPFVTTWKSSGSKIEVSLVGRYKYTWRNLTKGTEESNVATISPEHVLSLPALVGDLYQLIAEPIGIRYMTFERAVAYNGSWTIGTPGDLIRIESWGDVHWQTMQGMFRNCYSLTGFGADPGKPNMQRVTSMRNMFHSCKRFDADVSGWDVSQVQDMKGLFSYCHTFNHDLRSWDVSNATNMESMFRDARQFNQPLDTWNVGKVTTMLNMFYSSFKSSTFDQSLAEWTPKSLKTITLGNSNISVINYESTLAGWAKKKAQLPKGVRVEATGLKYSPEAIKHRDALRNEWGWQFLGDEPEPPVTNLAVDGSQDVSVGMGQTLKLPVKTLPANASPSTLEWRVEDAQYLEVDREGVVLGKKLGQAKVFVHAFGSPSIAVHFNVTVVDPTIIPLNGISFLKPLYTMTVGQGQLQLEGELQFDPEDATNTSVSWSRIAGTSASVSPLGIVSAIEEGESTIQATAEDGGQVATCKIVVLPRPTQVIIIDPPATLNLGAQHPFTARIEPAGAVQEVQWSVSMGADARFNSGGNILTVNAVEQVRVRATSVVDPTLYAEADLEVVQVSVVPLNGLEFLSPTYTLTHGEEREMAGQLLFKPNSATDKTLAFSVLEGAETISITPDGRLSTLQAGQAKIKATNPSTGIWAECAVVVAPKPTGVEITNAPSSATLNEMFTIDAQVLPAGAVQEVVWSANPSTAVHIEQNEITFIEVGTVTLRATTLASPPQHAEVSVEVREQHVVPVESLAFDAESYQIAVDQTLSLAAHLVFTPSTATNKEVAWSFDDSEAVSLLANGSVTGLKEGHATITVTTTDGLHSASCIVNVQPKPTAVRITTKPEKLVEGGEFTFAAQVEPANASQEVTWSVDRPELARFEDTKLVVLKPGALKVKVTSDVASDKFDEVEYVIAPKDPIITLRGISFKNATYTLGLDAELSLKSEVQFDPADATNRQVTFTLLEGDAVSVSSDGVVVPLKKGTAKVEATAADGGYKGTCTVTVIDGGAVVPLTGISFKQESYTVAANGSKELKGEIVFNPETATNKGVTFALKEGSEATATVSPEGLVTAKAAGEITVEATAADGDHKAICKVVVTDGGAVVPLTGITFKQESYSLSVNATKELKGEIVFNPETASNKGVTFALKEGSESTATVSAEGLVTAKAAGEITVEATAADGDHKAVCKVVVTDGGAVVPLTGITFKQESYTVAANGSKELKGEIVFDPETASNKGVTFALKEGSEATATVSPEGLVTAKAAGEITVEATAADGDHKAVCKIMVTDGGAVVPLTGITFKQESYSLSVNATKELNGEIVFNPETATNRGVTFALKEGSEATATVSAEGLVTAKAAGEITVEATAADGGHKAVCKIMVTDGGAVVPLTGITFKQESYTVAANGSKELKGEIVFNPETATNKGVTFALKEGSEATATVSTEGLVTAKAAGEITVEATAADGGHKAICKVTVLPADVPSQVSELLTGVHAYPNPFGDGLTLRHASEVVRFELVDASGRLALQGVHGGAEELRLDTRGLSAGLYMLRLVDADGGVRTLRLLKR